MTILSPAIHLDGPEVVTFHILFRVSLYQVIGKVIRHITLLTFDLNVYIFGIPYN